MKKLFNVSTDEELFVLLATEAAYILMLIFILVVLGSPYIFLSLLGFNVIYFEIIKLLCKVFVFTFLVAIIVGCHKRFKERKHK